MFEFKFPDIGEGIAEGQILKWKVKEGDNVKEDQSIAEVETDKAVADIPSPKAGKIAKLHFNEGDTVKVGDVIVTIAEKGEEATISKKEEKPEKKEAGKKPKSTSVIGEIDDTEEEIPSVTEQKKDIKPAKKIKALPAVRKLAKDLGVDISGLAGTGKNNVITKADVEEAAKSQRTQETKPTRIRAVKKYDFYGYIERVPLHGIRKTIARNMVKSYTTIPHVMHTDEIDVTGLVNLRHKEKLNAQKKGIKLTFLPFIIKAVISSLKQYPYVNASIEGEDIILKKYYNIGIAVDTPEGLMVPVVKNADSKSIFDIAKEIQALAEKARSRKIDLGDLKGGTFTITNIGSLGGIHATPIINPPECAILAPGRIKKQPKVLDYNVRIRDILPISLSFDHRIIDGAEAARFINDIKKLLEDPDLLLLD